MVTSMLEKAIEIEGLLRIIRDGNPLPETYILLNAKTAELAEQAVGLEVHTHEATPELQADFVMAPAPSAAPQPEVVFSVAEPDLKDEDLDLAEEDDIILSFDDPTDTVFQPADIPVFLPEESPASLPEGGATTASAPDQPAADPEEQEENRDAAEKPYAQEAIKPKESLHLAKRQTKLKSAFSLNDRFLYARELFNGNMKMFDSTLEFLEGLDEYSIVEDYFYSELEWNPEKPHVAAFMEILRPNFRE